MKPQRVVTAAEMRSIDQRTMAAGAPGIVLMENAAMRVVEYLAARFTPLGEHRIVVLCGKGNNGGDGFAVAKQLLLRFRPASLDVVFGGKADELTGDAALSYRMFQIAGGRLAETIEFRMQAATLVIDAVLGSGLNGPARGGALDFIRAINQGFPAARVVAVDVPSGMPSDSGDPAGECARADATVTFTAPRRCHALAPNCRHLGELVVAQIGTPRSFLDEDAGLKLGLIGPGVFRHLLAPRDPGGNKGNYGHVLVLAGSRSKSGAAAMSGLAALKAGAGLVTVASAASAIPIIAAHSPELMTEFLPETPDGAIASAAGRLIHELMEKRTLLAMGPGLGTHPETAAIVRDLFATCEKPMVVDADALNILAEGDWPERYGSDHDDKVRVLTPHPGEMARLAHSTIKQIQANRIDAARSFAQERRVTLVLKGERTLVAFPDGEVWINPTGSASMATGGTGDILTGITAGFVAQFPEEKAEAVAGAVWLHGRAGQIGADEIGEKPFVATDLLRFLPSAMKQAHDHHSDPL